MRKALGVIARQEGAGAACTSLARREGSVRRCARRRGPAESLADQPGRPRLDASAKGAADFIGRRIAKEDVELGGTLIPAGEQATVSLAAANRDPRQFADPAVYDISRPDASRHVAFGKGIHVCLGAPLARVEGQVAFTTLFGRFPELRSAVPTGEIRWGESFLRGFGRLPVLF